MGLVGRPEVLGTPAHNARCSCSPSATDQGTSCVRCHEPVGIAAARDPLQGRPQRGPDSG